MEKAIEFDIGKEELKKFLEECLTEENIDYEIKIENNIYGLIRNNNNLNNNLQFKEQIILQFVLF